MPEEQGPRPLSWILDTAGAYLAGRGVDSPRETAEHLAARLLRCRRPEIPARLSAPVAAPIAAAMGRGLRRVAGGEPLQYVLGQWDFLDFTLKTDRRALIPRPETEQLVELALSSRRLRSAAAPRILDYGTGSGCIAIALARAFPRARVAAVDVSAEALGLAAENAAALGVAGRVLFLDSSRSDLADAFEPASFDAIVSNPPYVPSAECDRLEPKVRDHEPRMALDGGPDGMDVLRQVCEEAGLLLAPEGELYLELDAESGQARPVSDLLRGLGFDPVGAHSDFAGKERFVSAVLPSGL